jgi:SET domain-containing protein
VRNSAIHGSGAFAVQRIRKGARVTEYTGERITNEEAFERYGESIAHTFLFTVDSKTVIDPQYEGNNARFINHSCDPNCASFQDKRRIFIEAIRSIEPGEELTYDYRLIASDTETDAADYPCNCGAERCRGTLLAPPPKRRAAPKASANGRSRGRAGTSRTGTTPRRSR